MASCRHERHEYAASGDLHFLDAAAQKRDENALPGMNAACEIAI